MNLTAVIVPTLGNESLTIRCFESLAKYTSNFALIWIDNGSSGASRGKTIDFLSKTSIKYESIFNESNRGFAGAINQGIRVAFDHSLDPIVFLNNDVTLTVGWLGKLKTALYWDLVLGVAGSIHDTGIQSYVNFAAEVGYQNTMNPERYFNSLSMRLHYTRNCVPFSLVAIPATVIRRVGFLDEEFYPAFGEDNDYCDRVRIAGYKTAFVLNCFTFHERRATAKTLPDYRRIQKRNEKLLWKKRESRSNVNV